MKTITWLRDAYRGFLWPFATFLSSTGYGEAAETHSRWHDARYPCLVAAIISLNTASTKIRRAALRREREQQR